VVKTFITTGLSPNFTAPSFDSTMKLITADSQKMVVKVPAMITQSIVVIKLRWPRGDDLRFRWINLGRSSQL
jgi:hypothetical protein